MNARRIYMLTAFLLLLAGVGLALYYRSYEMRPEALGKEQMGRLSARFLQNSQRDTNQIPTLEEVRRDAEEILCAKVVTHTLMADYDLLTEMKVTQVLYSESGLTEDAQIWVYEPISVFVYPDPDKLQKLDIVYEEGWINTDGFQLPLHEEQSYLLFLKKRVIADYYQYSERDQRTFLFSNRLVAAFPFGGEPVILEAGSLMSLSKTEEGMPSSLWKDCEEGVYVVNSTEQKNQLQQLVGEVMDNWNLR